MKKILATTLILAGIGGCGYLTYANNLKQETIDEQATKIEQLEEENSSRANEITSLKNTVATLQDEKADLEEEKLSLISSRTEKIQEINALNAEIEELQKENNDLKTGERILELEKQVSEYEAVSMLFNSEIERLNQEIETKNSTISIYEQYIADLEREEVTARFKLDDESIIKLIEYAAGDTLGTLPTIAETETLKFNYWYVEGAPGTPIDSTYVISEDTTFYADVTRYNYVNFTIDGTSLGENSQLIETGGYIDTTKVPIATKDGYTFKGWSADYGLTIIEDLNTLQITQNTELTAVFEINSYTITFKSNNVELTSVNVSHGCTIGENIPTPEVPHGMRFLGWKKDDGFGYDDLYNPQADWTVSEDSTYVASFEHLLAGTFKSEDGSVELVIDYLNNSSTPYLKTDLGDDSVVDLTNGIITDGSTNSYYKYVYDAETDTWSRTYIVVAGGTTNEGTPVVLSRTSNTAGIEKW